MMIVMVEAAGARHQRRLDAAQRVVLRRNGAGAVGQGAQDGRGGGGAPARVILGRLRERD